MTVPSIRAISKADPLMLRLWQPGREVFHSNTLPCLIKHPAQGDRLLESLNGDGSWISYEVRCLREKLNLDVIVIARKKA
jgi:hypothetical protein